MPKVIDIMKTTADWAKKHSWKNVKDSVSEFANSDTGKAIATGVTAAAPVMTGNHMRAGDGIERLGQFASNINPIAGAVLSLYGAGMNAAFGSNVNWDLYDQYNQQLEDYSRPDLSAKSNTQLLNQINGLQDLNFKEGDLGTQGWFNHDLDYAVDHLNRGLMAARTSRARMVDDAVSNVDKRQDAMIEANYRAFGGPIFGYMSDGAIAYDMAKDNLMAKFWNAQNKAQREPTSTAFAKGGLLSDNFTNGVMEIGAGGSHEKNPYAGVPMGIAEDGQPNLVEEGEAIYNDYVFSNRLRVPKAVRSKYKLRGPKDMTFAEAFLKAQEESEERENDPISKNGLDNIAMILAQAQEEMRAKNNTKKKAQGGHLYAGDDPDEPRVPGYYDEPGLQMTEDGLIEVIPPVTVTPKPKKEKSQGWNNTSANMLRFAEPAGNLFAVISDARGETNNPAVFDYIPDYMPLSFTPIGEYMPELKLDTRYAANQQAQQAAATRNAIMNTTAPNRFATLLAADYNAQNTYGNLLRDAELAEYENLLKARTFNRATNQFNSEMGLKTTADNNQQRLAYAQAKLAQAKANVDETNATMGAKAANIKALTTSLANMGRERDAYNWRDMLMRAGVFGTLSEKPTSWTDKQWNAYQENLRLIQEATTKACGGKLKKKGGFTY